VKTLEEPHPRRVIVLITPSVSPFVVLPTVVSRCQRISFHAVQLTEVAALLRRQGVPEDRAELLACVSHRRPTAGPTTHSSMSPEQCVPIAITKRHNRKGYSRCRTEPTETRDSYPKAVSRRLLWVVCVSRAFSFTFDSRVLILDHMAIRLPNPPMVVGEWGLHKRMLAAMR